MLLTMVMYHHNQLNRENTFNVSYNDLYIQDVINWVRINILTATKMEKKS